jgi:hypothetical protein
MTQKLQELFDLPVPEPEAADVQTPGSDSIVEQQTLLDSISDINEKIEQALPGVRDLETADTELDDLSNLAKENFENLINLAMNVEARYSGPILQSASTLLGHAITAKQTKLDKKLRMVELQLKKAALDHKISRDQKSASDSPDVQDGEGVVLDRNAMLEQILKQARNTNTE